MVPCPDMQSIRRGLPSYRASARHPAPPLPGRCGVFGPAAPFRTSCASRSPVSCESSPDGRGAHEERGAGGPGRTRSGAQEVRDARGAGRRPSEARAVPRLFRGPSRGSFEGSPAVLYRCSAIAFAHALRCSARMRLSSVWRRSSGIALKTRKRPSFKDSIAQPAG